MTPGRRSPGSVPVQVYLAGEDLRRLEQLADGLGLSKAEVVRRGLRALEAQVRRPGEHPLAWLAGIGRDRGTDAGDPAVEHDRVLGEGAWKSS